MIEFLEQDNDYYEVKFLKLTNKQIIFKVGHFKALKQALFKFILQILVKKSFL